MSSDRPRIDSAGIARADAIAQEDASRRALGDLSAGIPAMRRWNRVRQASNSITARIGDMVVYDPNDGCTEGWLVSARAEAAGKEVLFVRPSEATDIYTIRAHPGETIDGAATLTTSSRGSVELVVLESGKWTALVSGRVTTLETSVVVIQSIVGLYRSSPWWSGPPAADIPGVNPPTSAAGNYTTGCRFYACRPASVRGVSFRTAIAGAHTIRCKLWRYGNATALKSVDVACSGPGYYEGMFTTPYTIAAAEVGVKTFYVSTYETTGTNMTQIAGSIYGNTVSFPSHAYFDRAVSWAAGDANPSANSSASQTFPVDPMMDVLTYDGN